MQLPLRGTTGVLLLGFLSTSEGLKLNSNVSVQSNVTGVTAKVQVNHIAEKGDDEGCGLLTSFPNSKAADYKDSRKTKYDKDAKKSVKNTFKGGDTIKFKCESGFTTDGSKDGDAEFEVECKDEGYFNPKGVCSKASKCGKLPKIDNAAPTGKTSDGKTQFTCIKGYSLDGEKVVEGGEGKNSLFDVKCIDFKGTYQEFTGKCQPWAFVPATETIRMYNDVFKALFVVSCKGTMKKEFGNCGDKDCAPPEGLDSACGKISHDEDGKKKSKCKTLVSKIKSDFKSKESDRKTFDKENKRDDNWMETEEKKRPHLNDESEKFCSNLWGVLKVSR